VLDATHTCATLGIAQRPWREALGDMLRSVRTQEETG
jgi:hypothetical protein